MSIWLFRAGKSGQYETKFLTENKIYLTWDELNVDLKKIQNKQELLNELIQIYSDSKRNTVRNWLSQIWPFDKEMKIGDWIILPSKLKSAIHIAEITGDYTYHPNSQNPYFHSRSVKWIATDIPRSNFDQDLLYSFGAFMTVCRINRNNAEERIKAMSKSNWHSSDKQKIDNSIKTDTSDISVDAESDLELLANDQIAKFLIRKFKGHGMAVIIDAILKAKGYTTYRSPEGADKGVDILAAPEPMGFGRPRLCVQVKSGDTPIDRPTLDQLIGAMQNFNADQGLLVSWGGFKTSIDREIPSQFFRVRLWGQKEIIHELLLNYDKLDDEIKADIPLKRIWSLSLSDE